MARSRVLTIGRHAVPLVIMGAVALGIGGCQGDDDSDERPVGCGVLSAKTVESITGTSDTFSTGALGPREATGGRTDCQIVSASTPDVYAQLSASDKKIEDTQALLSTEKGSLQGCTTLTDLQGGGYLCARADEVEAAVALPGRMVRITVTSEGNMDEATPDNVVAWAEEIDDRISAYDDGD